MSEPSIRTREEIESELARHQARCNHLRRELALCPDILRVVEYTNGEFKVLFKDYVLVREGKEENELNIGELNLTRPVVQKLLSILQTWCDTGSLAPKDFNKQHLENTETREDRL